MKTLKQKSSHILSAFLNQIKDYIFPVYCLDCNKEGEWLCEDCYKKINLSGVFCCPVCHTKTSWGVVCNFCQFNSNLNSHLAITIYQEKSLVGEIIHTLKYSWAEDVLSVFEKMINDFVWDNKNLFSDIDCVISVPLHKKRFVERGFNQAELIANIVSKKINRPLKHLLERSRHTDQQAKLNREKRLMNLKNAFVVKEKVCGNVLLVDDVFTTGSTMQECAKALKNAGADKIVGFSIARG